MREFEIHYHDETVVRGGGPDDEYVTLRVPKSWIEAPSDGIQAIVAEDKEKGVVFLRDRDFYMIGPEDSHFKGAIMQTKDLGPYLRSIGLVKYGLWTNSRCYQELKNKIGESEFYKRLMGGNS
ncbi:MAG: hypothetical protein ACW99U_18895 [Candidatus Thorarchaeota archaeon]|jgi:hypothetical protein